MNCAFNFIFLKLCVKIYHDKFSNRICPMPFRVKFPKWEIVGKISALGGNFGHNFPLGNFKRNGEIGANSMRNLSDRFEHNFKKVKLNRNSFRIMAGK